MYKCCSLLLHLLVCKWSLLQHPIQSEVLLIRSCFETQFHNINKPPLITSYTIGRSLELPQTFQLKLFSSQLWCLTFKLRNASVLCLHGHVKTVCVFVQKAPKPTYITISLLCSAINIFLKLSKTTTSIHLDSHQFHFVLVRSFSPYKCLEQELCWIVLGFAKPTFSM